MEQTFSNDNLTFEMYSNFNKDHSIFLEKFGNDPDINEYIEEWQDLTKKSLEHNNTIFSYVVKSGDNLIGLCILCFVSDESVVLSLGILPEYRGYNYAEEIRIGVINVLKNEGIKKVVGYVRIDNENSIKNLNKNGYECNRKSKTNLCEVKYIDLENNMDLKRK